VKKHLRPAGKAVKLRGMNGNLNLLLKSALLLCRAAVGL
jgi:hypothetical protein